MGKIIITLFLGATFLIAGTGATVIQVHQFCQDKEILTKKVKTEMVKKESKRNKLICKK